MGKGYFCVFCSAVAGFIGLALLMTNLDWLIFTRELYLFMFLLIIAGLGLYGIRKANNLSWMLFTVFFAAMLLNLFYVILNRSTGILGWIISGITLVILLYGFFSSVSGISCMKTCHKPGAQGRAGRGKLGAKKGPRIIIEDYSEGRKVWNSAEKSFSEDKVADGYDDYTLDKKIMAEDKMPAFKAWDADMDKDVSDKPVRKKAGRKKTAKKKPAAKKSAKTIGSKQADKKKAKAGRKKKAAKTKERYQAA